MSKWRLLVSRPRRSIGMERYAKFKSGNIELAGTLAIPEDFKGKLPAFVLVCGSGPNDRDYNPDPKFVPSEIKELLKKLKIPLDKLKLNIYNRMSDHLIQEGFAVLRYDKRGVGASEGDYKKRRLKDLITDVHAAIKFVRSQTEVDPSKVGIIGHSEGGIIGPVVCAEDPAIAALVVCSASASKFENILLHQAEHNRKEIAQMTPEEREKWGIKEGYDPVKSTLEIIEKVKKGEEYIEISGEKESTKWWREHFEHDPIATIRRVKCPVLIVHGEKDFQVPYENATRLKNALMESGNAQVTSLIFPNIDHLLKFEPQESGEFRYAQTLDREVEPIILKSISSWAKQLFFC